MVLILSISAAKPGARSRRLRRFELRPSIERRSETLRPSTKKEGLSCADARSHVGGGLASGRLPRLVQSG